MTLFYGDADGGGWKVDDTRKGDARRERIEYLWSASKRLSLFIFVNGGHQRGAPSAQKKTSEKRGCPVVCFLIASKQGKTRSAGANLRHQ